MNRQLAKQYFERAETLLNAGQPGEALALLSQLDEAFPDTKNIGVARARTYAALGQISDAVQLCEQLIVQHDSRRAKDLKERLLLGVLEPEGEEANAIVPRRSLLGVARVVILLLIFGGAIGLAVWYVQRMNTTPAATPSTRETRSIGFSLGQLEPQSSESAPGRTHPPQTWELDDAGVPKWKSGIFRRVPCIDAPDRTIDVYLPMAYDDQPEMLFPGVVISLASGNPGSGKPRFLGLESWAERQEVILILLNSSRNGPSQNNMEAQDAALRTIAPSLRVNQEAGFAIGMSGGAMASWLLATRYPDNFRGVVMMGQGGFEERVLAPHIRVAYIRGFDEPNNWYIPRVIENLKANGNQVRDQLVPGAHVMGPLETRVEMLNWMVYAARRDLGLPQPSG